MTVSLDLVAAFGLVGGLGIRGVLAAVAVSLDLVAGLVLLARPARPVLVRHRILLVVTPFAPSARHPL